MARAADFDLRTALASRSFTPGARDAPELVALIVAGDEPAAARAAPALARLGETGRAAIAAKLAGASTTDDGARARLVSALGLLARSGSGEARAEVLARIDDVAPRVRKAAAVALGKLGGDDARAALIARWDAGDATADERRALAEALGKLGGDDALARLRSLDAGDDPELARRRDRGVLMAERTAGRGADSRVIADAAPPSPITVQLGCRPGLGALLFEELSSLGLVTHAAAGLPAQRSRASADPGPPRATSRGSRAATDSSRPDSSLQRSRSSTDPGPARATSRDSRASTDSGALDLLAQTSLAEDRGVELSLAAPLSSLFAARLWVSLAIPFPLAVVDDLADAITQTIASPPVLGVLRGWTRGPIRWRLGFAHGHKRAVVWRVARDVAAAAPDLVNDPTATTWDILVDDEARTLAVQPRRLDDPRFVYRVADIPAASHPTVAAALAWLAEPRPADRVWDPFCGSGLELIECARRGPVRSLLGSDLDPQALDAARANLAAAAVTTTLIAADARLHDPGPIDLIITNPPLGSRVQLDAAALLVAALPNLARALASQGRLVWITPSPRKTSPAAEQLGLTCRRRLPVDLGGVRGQLERWDRR